MGELELELEQERRTHRGGRCTRRKGSRDWVRTRGDRGNDEFEEGLRMRRREYDMPGGMPGMMMNFD